MPTRCHLWPCRKPQRRMLLTARPVGSPRRQVDSANQQLGCLVRRWTGRCRQGNMPPKSPKPTPPRLGPLTSIHIRLTRDVGSRAQVRIQLFEHKPVGGEIWIALAWCVGIVLVAYAFAMVVYRRKIA